MATAKKLKKKKSPFKTKKNNEKSTSGEEPIIPPEDIKEAVDSFVNCKQQEKHLKGEATVYKDQIQDFAHRVLSKRIMSGKNGSFKIVGNESVVNFVVADASAGLTDADVELISEKWGEEASDELVVDDYSTVKFNVSVLEKHFDLIVDKLNELPEEIVDNLYKPMSQKAAPGAVEKIAKYAKTEAELKEMIKLLKIKAFVK